MIKINAVDYTGCDADPRESGKAFYDFLKDTLTKGESMEINMANAVMPSLFLNTSFHPVIEEFGIAEVRSRIKFTGMSRPVFNIIKKYFDHYAEVNIK